MPPTDAPGAPQIGAADAVGLLTAFGRQVRDALLRLDDLLYLQTHPLARFVAGSPGPRASNRGKELQRAMLEAIQALQPDPARGKRDVRSYLILTLRYTEARSVAEVQEESGIRASEYHRSHRRALDAVISLLQEQWHVEQQGVQPPAPRALPPSASRGLPTNLPLALTSFVGREEEMAELVGRLRDATGPRLLTLTGAGGCGKSRLALEVARRVLGEFSGGVWLVELAAVADPGVVPSAVAQALGVPERPAEPILLTLARVLAARRMLIVLDNCEQVVAACAVLAQALLRLCPRVQVLATSREALAIEGEVLWRVPSLEVPPSGIVQPQQLATYDAIHLFVDRAQDVQTAFVLTEHRAAAVAEICRQLDGIPLAIELAAARLPALSTQQIADRLDDRFRLLTAGNRTAVPRQQTMRASIDWSYELLGDAERSLFNRLAVFIDGFTLEAAEAVCGDEADGADGGRGTGDRGRPDQSPVPREDVLDLLTRLIDKSLVVSQEQGGEARCRLLETIWQYAAQKLLASDEAPRLRDRHCDWCLALAEQAAPELHRRDQVVWLDRLEREGNNLRAAMAWLGAHERWVDALRLANALGWFWVVRGYYAEGRARLTETLAPAEGLAGASLRARAYHALAYLTSRQGDLPATHRYREECLSAATQAGDRPAIAEALALAGTTERDAAPDLARRHLNEALALARELDLRAQVGPILVDLGVVAAFQGDLDGARARFAEGLAILREEGDVARLAFGLNLACMIGDLRGDYPRVRALAEEYLTLAEALEDRSGQANCYRYQAKVAWWEGDVARAEALLTQALTFYRDVDDRYGVAWAAAALSRVHLALGEVERAVALAEEGLALARAMDERLLMRALRAVGDAALARGEVTTAASRYREGLGLMANQWVGMWRSALIEGLAKVAAAQDRPARALRLAGAAAADLARLGATASPIDLEWLARALEPARQALSEAESAAAYARGQAMTLEQAVAHALREEDGSTVEG